MKYNYVLMSTSFSPYKYMYKDIIGLDNVKIYWEKEELLKNLSSVEQVFAKIWRHPRINRIVNLPGQDRWFFRALKKIRFAQEKPLCFIWHYNFYKEIEKGFLDEVKRAYPKAKHVFTFSDPSFINEDIVRKLKDQMDFISVFDPLSAAKYGIECFPNVYPEMDEKAECEYDICFIGADRGREEDLLSFAEACKENGVKAKFIVHTKKYDQKDLNNELGIEYIRTKMPYTDVVDIVKRSRCLLELKIEPYNTCSLRIQEAVVMGKKLVTNNRNVYHMPCCKGSRWIQCYERIQDIDWAFVKKEETVDYGYNGEYSAVKWLEKIESLIK